MLSELGRCYLFLTLNSQGLTQILETLGVPLLTLGGTLLGASIGSFVTWRTTRTALLSARRDYLLDLRREEYFIAIGIVHQMEVSLTNMGDAISGRQDPSLFSSPRAKRTADEKDQQAAEAIGNLMDSREELKLEVYRLQAIGAVEVRRCINDVSNVIDEYFDELVARNDRRFIGQEFVDTMGEFSSRQDLFLAAIRRDLKVDQIL